MRHVEARDLANQWQLVVISMRDANMAGQAPPRTNVNQTSFRDLAGKFLDDYFDMVEQILRDHEQSASYARRQ